MKNSAALSNKIPSFFINGQYNEATAKAVIEQKISEYKLQKGKKPPTIYILKSVYNITPSGNNKKYQNALNELEYLTGISWRRLSSESFSLREQCYIKNGFLIIGKNLINLTEIKMVKSNDINLSLIVDKIVYDNWDDDDQFLKKGTECKLNSCDRAMMSRIKSLML
jgi:hypothetical protein